MKKVFLALLPIMLSKILMAQNIQQNEPFIKWKQIETANFKIIYPEELSSEAQRVANTLEYVRTPLQKTLQPKKMRKWTLMLTNQGAMSNGYVGLAPRRSEWYSVPPQGSLLGTGEWYNLLAVHEGRHMVQYDKFNMGLTHLASFLFGQSAVNALSMLSVPIWFWEGDAVGTETTLTASGRGRIPEFDLHVRALLLSDIRYSYYKAYMQSYKDYFPNWYTLGYLMNCFVRRHNSPEIWNKIHNRTAWFSVSPFRFSRMMKKYTGLNARETYKAAMDELDSIYRWQINGLIFTDARIITKRKNKIWTNYENPVYIDGSIIALEYGLADDIYLVKINPDNGSVKKIKQLPVYEKPSIAGDYICYNEYNFDRRYLNQNYSNLVLYNYKTNEIKYLSKEGRFFVPEISPDFSKIVAVEFTTDRKCNLIFFDFKTGEILKRIPEKDNAFIQTPSWSEDGKQIVFIRQKFNGKSLVVLDLESEQSRVIIPDTWENIANPVFYKHFIFYESSYSGIDNLYAIDLQTGQKYQVTNRPLAAVNASLSEDGSEILFLDYSINGYNIAEMPVNPSSWKKIEEVEIRETRYFQPLIEQEQGYNLFEGDTNIPKIVYPEQNYHQSAHLFNFHSWTLIPLIKAGSFSILSNDLLNTTAFNISADYNRNEKTYNLRFSLNYNRFYPLFSILADGGNRNTDGKIWHEKNLLTTVEIPWVNNRGPWQRFAMFSLSAGVRNVDNRPDPDSFQVFNGQLIPLHLGFRFSNVRNSAMRDIDSRLSQAFEIKFSQSLFSDKLKGNIFSFHSAFNFPGIFKHHVITMEADYEKHQHESYWFPSNLSFTRGYEYKNQDIFRRLMISYRFPLFYPDMAIGALFFLKRLKGAVFYDHGAGNFQGMNNLFRSAGFDLEIDFNILNLPFELNAGIRIPYLIDTNEWKFRFLFFGLEF